LPRCVDRSSFVDPLLSATRLFVIPHSDLFRNSGFVIRNFNHAVTALDHTYGTCGIVALCRLQHPESRRPAILRILRRTPLGALPELPPTECGLGEALRRLRG
jgi:hypothetical protein